MNVAVVSPGRSRSSDSACVDAPRLAEDAVQLLEGGGAGRTEAAASSCLPSRVTKSFAPLPSKLPRRPTSLPRRAADRLERQGDAPRRRPTRRTPASRRATSATRPHSSGAGRGRGADRAAARQPDRRPGRAARACRRRGPRAATPAATVTRALPTRNANWVLIETYFDVSHGSWRACTSKPGAARQHELAGGLEVVADAVERRQVRVAVRAAAGRRRAAAAGSAAAAARRRPRSTRDMAVRLEHQRRVAGAGREPGVELVADVGVHRDRACLVLLPRRALALAAEAEPVAGGVRPVVRAVRDACRSPRS